MIIKYIQTIDKYIKTIINKKISKQLPIHLGRWNIEQCNKKTNNKVDLANEDHRDRSSQSVIDKIKN
jgi:hypothetical protein